MLPALAWTLTFIFVILAWVLFRTPSIGSAATMFSGMAGLNGLGWAGGNVGPPELRECVAGLSWCSAAPTAKPS